jgi:5-enolpyruvylshikimate-3-phosphate synthase
MLLQSTESMAAKIEKKKLNALITIPETKSCLHRSKMSSSLKGGGSSKQRTCCINLMALTALGKMEVSNLGTA